MKSILIASSFLVISIASLFTSSEINVNFNVPSSITAGESFIMDIEIEKGDISDFAKLQLSLPEGFSAELFEGQEGTFTFYDQKVKLIWISLPAEPKFNVKLKIGCDTSLVGDYNFEGKISYVLEGERKNKELVSPTLNITPKSKTTSPNIASANPIINNTDIKSIGTELSCSRSFDALRVGPGETFQVTLTVEKSNVSGVGKIIENIPNGFTAQEIENNGAIFSQKGDQVKFLWMTLPSDNKFTVSYKIMVDEKLDGNKVIDGKMSYLDGDITKNALIDGTSIEITKTPLKDVETAAIEQENKEKTTISKKEEKGTQENNIVDNTLASSEEKESVKNISTEVINDQKSSTTEIKTESKNTNIEKAIASSEEKNSNQVVNTTEDNTTSLEVNKAVTQRESNLVDNKTSINEENNKLQNETTTSIDNTTATIENKNAIQTENNNTSSINEVTSNHKVNYRVQICALRKKTETKYFTKNHNVKEKIYLNMHEGWHKYTVGDFKEYMLAREHRSTAKSNYKINGSFVTAYNDGSRITVQEALMITKDKWVAP